MANINEVNPLAEKLEELWKFSSNLIASTRIMRWIGYLLLLLFIFDLFEIFVPPRFTDPEWEFQSLGALVEKVAIPLIAFAFIFQGRQYFRSNWENIALKVLSWASLLLGIVYLLIVPIAVVNAVRIDRANTTLVGEQTTQAVNQVQQVKDVLKNIQTPEQMAEFIGNLDNRGRRPVIGDLKQTKELKSQLSTHLAQTEKNIKSNADKTLSQRRKLLLKSSVKWSVGALLSGSLFVLIWRSTEWARRLKSSVSTFNLKK